ncbi:SPARC-related modular calcium-binding protein 2 isoform X2 [Ixodes scapularis]|uniref:SPARC-related modular calcium-binding protein 2 isoform X2 n=1 Tax=Ixodes scapularis TaxID=6945 RepID=UPI001A9E71A3|nr:SPARC-related modular calcium-binding protein 2 isoform X2 [Ixodes scapularis]
MTTSLRGGSLNAAVRWSALLLALLQIVWLPYVSAQLPLRSSDGDASRKCAVSDADCSEADSRVLCGSDGRTYSSQCEVDRARCEGHLVEVKHEGQCPDARRCWSQRSQALEQVRSGASGVFVPDCSADGAFVQVQCHRLTGYCWCVDAQGKVLSGSSVQNKRPNCTHPDKKTTFQRRAPRRGLPKKGCTNADRSQFNGNLVDIFQKEFKRLPSHPASDMSQLPASLLDTTEKQVIQWKFTELDLNRDEVLQRREVRDLRRMARRFVEPRACARSFTRYCDHNQDKRISRSEWSVCLGVDINNEEHGGAAAEAAAPSTAPPAHRDRAAAVPRTPSMPRPALQDSPRRDPGGADEFLLSKVARSRVVIGGGDEDDDRNDGERLRPPGGVWGDPDTRLNSGTRYTDDQDVLENKDEDEVQDCSSARRKALEAHRQAPKGRIYVPECGSDGTYAEAQCHTGYCWCVNQRTGRPIRGIATLGVKPDCAAARLLARSFKGCSYKKKQTFLTELIDNFRRDKERNGSSPEGPAPITRDEAVRWKFSSLDVNLNKVLERREWKPFRRGWKDFLKNGSRTGGGRKKLRKCWRNFLRYCDEDADNRVTFDEWIKCTEQAPVPETSTRLPTNPNRKGPNPFATILRST